MLNRLVPILVATIAQNCLIGCCARDDTIEPSVLPANFVYQLGDWRGPQLIVLGKRSAGRWEVDRMFADQPGSRLLLGGSQTVDELFRAINDRERIIPNATIEVEHATAGEFPCNIALVFFGEQGRAISFRFTGTRAEASEVLISHSLLFKFHQTMVVDLRIYKKFWFSSAAKGYGGEVAGALFLSDSQYYPYFSHRMQKGDTFSYYSWELRSAPPEEDSNLKVALTDAQLAENVGKRLIRGAKKGDLITGEYFEDDSQIPYRLVPAAPNWSIPWDLTVDLE